tara:strand:+ start:1128 stop:1328 length:201 start_codon:yes stop_codon:yes gene_type:complete
MCCKKFHRFNFAELIEPDKRPALVLGVVKVYEISRYPDTLYANGNSRGYDKESLGTISASYIGGPS